MANYVCIRVIAKPVEGAEEYYRKLCTAIEDPDEFIEAIEGDTDRLWLDYDYEPVYDSDSAYFQLIAKYNYPRYELEEGFSENYIVDYDIVFADEFEDYDIDYKSNNLDDILQETGCIGVYRKKIIHCEYPNDGFDYEEKYFFPQNDDEKHLMYIYAWADSYFSEVVDRKKLYHTNPDDPEDECYDLRDEMNLEDFIARFTI